jgi:4'-phosphopantetheinyl transferase
MRQAAGHLNKLLATGAVHVWHAHARSEHPQSDSYLNDSELARSKRFHNAVHGRHWRYFHCALREVLARYAKAAPAALNFAKVESDKPVLADFPQLHFNLSHAGDRALIAITRNSAVGVDIELQRQLTDRTAMVGRYFSMAEQQQLADLPDVEQDAAFFRLWTRKEAVIKANGLGLGIELSSFDVPCTALPAWTAILIRNSPNSKKHYLLRELAVASGHAGAVALESASASDSGNAQLQSFEYRP